jgi:hypothetical protein
LQGRPLPCHPAATLQQSQASLSCNTQLATPTVSSSSDPPVCTSTRKTILHVVQALSPGGSRPLGGLTIQRLRQQSWQATPTGTSELHSMDSRERSLHHSGTELWRRLAAWRHHNPTAPAVVVSWLCLPSSLPLIHQPAPKVLLISHGPANSPYVLHALHVHTVNTC